MLFRNYLMNILLIISKVANEGLFGNSISSCPSDDDNLSLWSDPSTWGGNLPLAGQDVTISKSILLDIVTPNLGAITISPEARLIFSPKVPLAKLSTTRIYVKGELWIGSEDCPFTGNAEIFLLGAYNASAEDPQFGQKFVGVPSGGTLELHGKKKLHWTKLTKKLQNSNTISSSADSVVLNLLDDVTSWEPNDSVVVASSSYDWKEAEVLKVLPCPTCTSHQLLVQGPINYTHLGEVVDDVDRRAEVGLLTRNIKIHGEMQSGCYADMKCNEFPYDTYGGHVKILFGFKNAHVEGVELFDVGQQTFLGNYPLHFHMDRAVGNYTYPPYFRSNSVHRSYSRCYVVHGTFSATVSYNVGYDNLGHCYYLEDGGEKNTTIEYNLAIGTRVASLTPSDATDVASYFISLPMSYIRNNVAAGSDGHGLMYVFPYQPVGVSYGLGFLATNQSMHTPIYQFKNNVAHSNAKIGLYFDNILGVSHEIIDTNNQYNPLKDPLNFKSSPVSVTFDGFTGYGNTNSSVWLRGAETYLNDFKISESGRGVVLLSSTCGSKHLVNSIVHGSIDNKPSAC
ncbi:hypothetical protein CHUAL_002503 [Chamberlinius hualienensis]